MTPNYANIFMHNLNMNFLSTTTYISKMWVRYIDDIFMIWLHGPKELKNLVVQFNNSHTTIKFTPIQSTKEIPILNTLVHRRENGLATRLYHKSTDNKQYLHFKTAYPKDIKKVYHKVYSLDIKGYVQITHILKKKTPKLSTN